MQKDGGSISIAVLIPFGDCGEGFGGGSGTWITPDSEAEIIIIKKLLDKAPLD